MDKKAQIQELISLGKTEEALELLEQLTTDAILLQSRFNGAKRQYSMGMIDFSEWSRTQAQINYAALEMMNGVKEGGLNKEVNTQSLISQGITSGSLEDNKKVFISYNHDDSFAMRSVKNKLEEHTIQVYVDFQEMMVGDSISAFIDKALKENQFILSIISRNSLRSGWVNKEFSAALLLNRFGKKWLPVMIDNSAFDDKFIVETQVDLDKKIARLKKEISTALEKGRDIRPYTDEFERLTDLKNDFGKNIQTLKNYLSVDISGPMFEVGMSKIIKAIKS